LPQYPWNYWGPRDNILARGLMWKSAQVQLLSGQAAVQAILEQHQSPLCIALQLLQQSPTGTPATAMVAIHSVWHPLIHEKRNPESETICKNMMT
jgi:hypothetical protein